MTFITHLGKQNIKRNRQLLLDFFLSAQQVIDKNTGVIKLSLCLGHTDTVILTAVLIAALITQ